MNIFKRELKAGLKVFLFWTLGLFVLLFAGVVKFAGVSAGGAGMADFLEAIPRIVQAVFGMVGVDIGTFGGYYAVLSQYVLILVAIYAVHLGGSAVSREFVDKTYEFVFTKPRTRSHILLHKLLSGLVYLTLFCVLGFVFSAAAAAKLGPGGLMTAEFALYAASEWLLGLLFFALAAMLAALAKSAEKGARLSNALVLVTYVLGVGYDMLEHGGLLRLLSPFKYFAPSELLARELSPLYAAVCVLIALAALGTAFRAFGKRDLNAV